MIASHLGPCRKEVLGGITLKRRHFRRRCDQTSLLVFVFCRQAKIILENLTSGQSNSTKSASRGPIHRLGVTPGVESCIIEFLG